MAQNMDQAIAALAPRLNPDGTGMTDYELRFLQDELSATRDRNLMGTAGAIQTGWQALNGAKFMDFGPKAWGAALDAAENFAANTDWKMFPTQDQLQQAINSGVNFSDPKAFATYMLPQIPSAIQKNMPWIKTGQSATSFRANLQSWEDTYTSITGAKPLDVNPNWAEDAASLMAGGMTASQWHDTVMNDKGTQERFGWVKAGLTYTAFQQLKNDPQHRQAVISRFGVAKANDDSAYLENLNKPNIAAVAAGGAIRSGGAREQANKIGQTNIR